MYKDIEYQNLTGQELFSSSSNMRIIFVCDTWKIKSRVLLLYSPGTLLLSMVEYFHIKLLSPTHIPKNDPMSPPAVDTFCPTTS